MCMLTNPTQKNRFTTINVGENINNVAEHNHVDKESFKRKVREHWKKHVKNGYVYHGTTKLLLDHILERGLEPDGIFHVVPRESFEKLLRFLYGNRVGKYYTEDVTGGVYVTHTRANAREYAGPPERLHILLEEALHHVDRMPPT